MATVKRLLVGSVVIALPVLAALAGMANFLVGLR